MAGRSSGQRLILTSISSHWLHVGISHSRELMFMNSLRPCSNFVSDAKLETSGPAPYQNGLSAGRTEAVDSELSRSGPARWEKLVDRAGRSRSCTPMRAAGTAFLSNYDCGTFSS